jgi:hypothetical protein
MQEAILVHPTVRDSELAQQNAFRTPDIDPIPNYTDD